MHQVSPTQALDGTLAIALAFATIHLLSPRLLRWHDRRGHVVSALGAGAAVAYVFVQLLPELALSSATADLGIALTALAGFLLSYRLELTMPTGPTTSRQSLLDVAPTTLYNLLLIVALPLVVEKDALGAAIVAVGLSLHIWHQDSQHAIADPQWWARTGRWVVMAGTISGILIDTSLGIVNDDLVRVMTACIAGGTLRVTFHHELSGPAEGRFPLVVLGAALFAGLAALASVV